MSYSCCTLGGFVLVGALTSSIFAETITVSCKASGWYDSRGLHDARNPNYMVGNESGRECRDFFVFDLSGVRGSILAARLVIANGPEGFLSPSASETVQLYDVSAEHVPLLFVSGVSTSEIFADLGTGVLYSSRKVTLRDNDTLVRFDLNANAVADMNQAIASQQTNRLFAIGGRMSTLDYDPETREYFGGYSNDPDSVRYLELETTHAPEPGPLISLLTGAIALGMLRRLRQPRWARPDVR